MHDTMWSIGSTHSTIIRSIIELNWCPVSAGQPRTFSIFLHESPPQLLQADQFECTGGHSKIAFTTGRAVDAHPWNNHVYYNRTSNHN